MTHAFQLPATMTAITITAPGGPEVLVPGERPMPVPGPREILVKVEAAGVNRPDVVQRRGLYPAPPGASDIPGLEIAGTVVALGAEVTRFKLGDAVCALVTGGGYAQYCLSHEATALPVPEGLSMVEAAAIPETFFTVWSNVFDRAGLKRGETLLVHGGTGGIGTTAIQLGKAFGATVITTAGSAEKCTACLKLGADHAIDYKTQDFVAEVKSVTGGKGANVILDVVGGAYIQRNYEAAAVEGRIVQIAFQDGSKVNIDFMRLMLKRLTHTGSTLRARPVADKEAIANALTQHVIPLIAAGTVRPLIDCTFPLEKANEAHVRMDTSAHIGKIMLIVA
ncbi:NAD(P)H-quinone oxidoreductase [Roseixanthobacter liquoris]|uniref:NAD(P)H-quinone oxidoreductase n=1 Tax=Roseixanthobacter liquoris TaxID=3119921 RepID=UPI003729DFEC